MTQSHRLRRLARIVIIGVLTINYSVFINNCNANPGDTTWIQANNVQLNYYNNFDTAVAFPNASKTYRKILMYFTLGEYACPSGSTYCHQWDYTVTNYVMTHTDTIELSRFITPFATTGTPRFTAAWKQVYIYNVTDFYNLLQDSATIRILYSGYSGGFTANVKFAFIEGVPERNVYGVTPLWKGAYNYGNSADPISNHLPTLPATAPANTQTSELKLTVTGHGSDNTTQCCEFASHNYSVTLNNSVIASKAVWRDDCGFNELYPQGGTWIYNRGGWCPGDYVYVNTHPLTGITASSSYSLGLGLDTYTTTGNYGDYDIEGHVFYYGNCNHVLDASLEDIISPNNFADHFRENPSGINPVVHVRNSGSSVINSIVFNYFVQDSVPNQYTWNGALPSMRDTDITLDPLNSLMYMSMSGGTGVHSFVAQIISVNGTVDEDTTNNNFRSSFMVAPTWPTTFVVDMFTNNEGVSGVGTNPCETNWQITDMYGNILVSRTNASISTSYKDTVTLPAGAFYNLTIADGSCDGLQWWANSGTGITAGTFEIKKLGNVVIPMNGYNYSGTYNNDFGCGFSQYFTTGGSLTGIHNITPKDNSITMMAYPNPAQDNVTVTISGIESATGQFELIDGLGRSVLIQKANGIINTINLNGMLNGIYTITYRDAQVPQIQTRMIIAK